MLERAPDSKFDASCDTCPDGWTTVEADDFYDAVDALKRDGWRIFKEDGEWYHACPDCRSAVSEFGPIP